MANLKILGLPDLFTQRGIEITALSEASASMAAANLKTTEPSEFWRSTSNIPTKAWIDAINNGIPGQFTASGYGFVGSNLWINTGEVRFITFSTPETIRNIGFEELKVDAIEASSGLTGTVADIDEGFAADSNWVTANSIRVGFESPAGTPNEGTRVQTFWVYVRADNETEIYNSPRVIATLFNNGVEIASLGTKSVVSTTGQWLKFPWEFIAANYGAGADIELQLEFEPGDTANAELGSAVWDCENDDITVGTNGIIDDSGYLPMGPEVGIPGSAANYLVDEVLSETSLMYDFSPELATARAVWCLIREDHSPDLDQVNVLSLTTKPFGYVEAGHLGGGVVFSPAANFDAGDILGFPDLSSEASTTGGQEFGSRRRVLRTANLPLSALTRAEAAVLADRLVRRKGALSPVMVKILGDDASLSELSTFFASLDNPETVVGLSNMELFGASAVLRFKEKV